MLSEFDFFDKPDNFCCSDSSDTSILNVAADSGCPGQEFVRWTLRTSYVIKYETFDILKVLDSSDITYKRRSRIAIVFVIFADEKMVEKKQNHFGKSAKVDQKHLNCDLVEKFKPISEEIIQLENRHTMNIN